MSNGAVGAASSIASVGNGATTRRSLPWPEQSIEALVGNILGAGIYRRWVDGLGLAGDETVLEVGAGGGACSRHLTAVLPEGRLTCLEMDPRWLAVARRRLAGFAERVEFVQADAAEWSRPGQFDVATAHFVLHDIPSPQRLRVLRRIAVSLGLGGCLCLREPLMHGMTAEELRWQLAEAGFELAGDATHCTLPLMGPTIAGVWTL